MRTSLFDRLPALLVASLALLAPSLAAGDQPLDTIQARIKDLEEQQARDASSLAFWNEALANLRTGKYVVFPHGFEPAIREKLFYSGPVYSGPPGLPVPREHFEAFLASALRRGLDPDTVKALRFIVDRVTQTMLAELPAEIEQLQANQTRNKDDLAHFYDERARIRESLDTYNPVRNCNWQVCGYQWLAHTCTEKAITGTTRKSCEEWGGTYWHTNGHCGKGQCEVSLTGPKEGHFCCR